MDESSVAWLVDYVWIPLWASVLELFRRYLNLTKTVTRLEALEEQRSENHQQTMKALHDHNDSVIGKIDVVHDQVKSNGRRIGTIEKALINNGMNKALNED